MEATVEVVVPGQKMAHKYFYVPIQPIPARRVQRIPFSHPRQIFPLLKVPSPRFLANSASPSMVQVQSTPDILLFADFHGQ